MPIATPASNATSSSSNSQATGTAGKGKSSSNATNAFTQMLNGKLETQSSNDPADVSDQATSMAGLLQMLQTLVMPMQNLQAAGTDANAGESTEAQPVSEMLLQAMNSNPALAEQILQDPKMQQWFAQADQLLGSLTNKSTQPAFTMPMGLAAQSTDALNLQAQNTLLTLTTLTKQQPDNPILQYLNQNLENSMTPLLPQLLANTNVLQETEIPATMAIQPAKSKLEVLAQKNVLNASVIKSHDEDQSETESQRDLLTDTPVNAHPMMTLTDLQKAQLSTVPLEKPATYNMNAANFSEEMTEHVLKNMKITMAGGISEAKISLFPKNLGHIDVKLVMNDGQLVAHFAAETLAGKQMLESQLPQLRHALQSQGLQVEKLEVTQNADMQSSMFQDGRQGQSSNQSQRQNKSRNIDFDTDAIEFNEEIEKKAQTRAAVYGNSMDVTA